MSNEEIQVIEESPIFTSEIEDYVNSESEVDALLSKYEVK